MNDLIMFIMKNPNKWHTFKNDFNTRKKVAQALGFNKYIPQVKVNEFNQIMFIEIRKENE